MVDRHRQRYAVESEILNVRFQIGDAARESFEILLIQPVLGYAAVVFQRAHRRHEHDRVGMQPGRAALDVEEFLRAQIGAETRLGDAVVGQLHCRTRGDNRIAAVCDVGKRPAVDHAGRVFHRLHEVGLDCILKQCAHRALHAEVAAEYGLSFIIICDDHPSQPLAQVGQRIGKAENRHNLRRHGDHETFLAHHAVGLGSEADDSSAQRPVVHIHAALMYDALGVDAQRVPLVQVVVQNRRKQVIGRSDGVEIAGEVQIDFVHRYDLRIAAARRAALDAEYRTERRLAQGDDRLFADVVHRLSQSDRGCRFTFTGRCG